MRWLGSDGMTSYVLRYDGPCERLLDDLGKEYYAIVDVVSGYDQRLMVSRDGQTRCPWLAWDSVSSRAITHCLDWRQAQASHSGI
jgi:hypothetical protein